MSLKRKLHMVICLLGLCHCVNHAIAQTNRPRYLKRLLSFCPIDISKANTNDGLFQDNNLTIRIDSTVVFKEVTALVPQNDSTVWRTERIKVRAVEKDTVLMTTILMEPGLSFNVVQQIGSYTVVKFWPTRDKTLPGLYTYLDTYADQSSNGQVIPRDALFEKLKIKVKDGPDGKLAAYDLAKSYYIVATQALVAASTEFDNQTGDWNLGFLVLPVKLRPFATERGQFDFSDGYSVGTTFALTIAQNINTGLTQSLLLYAGISSYTADSAKLKEVRNDYKIAAFSPAVGYMLEKNNVQLSIIIGFDFPAGNLQRKWVYRNQPWFGIGIGFSLFKISADDSVETGTN